MNKKLLIGGAIAMGVLLVILIVVVLATGGFTSPF